LINFKTSEIGLLRQADFSILHLTMIPLMRYNIALVALAILVVNFLGCSHPEAVPLPNYGSEEGLKIAQMVSEFNDWKAHPAKFKKAFAATVPANFKDYEKFTYNVVVGSPKVDGSSATASVTIHKESNYEVVATKDWSFTKAGNDWKIKDAPLK
jgi:hypothetical protein